MPQMLGQAPECSPQLRWLLTHTGEAGDEAIQKERRALQGAESAALNMTPGPFAEQDGGGASSGLPGGSTGLAVLRAGAGGQPRTESLAPKSRDLTHAGRCVSPRAKAPELPTRSDYRPDPGGFAVTVDCGVASSVVRDGGRSCLCAVDLFRGRSTSIAAGVDPQSSCSLNPPAPPRSCSRSASWATVLPFPRSSTLTDKTLTEDDVVAELEDGMIVGAV